MRSRADDINTAFMGLIGGRRWNTLPMEPDETPARTVEGRSDRACPLYGAQLHASGDPTKQPKELKYTSGSTGKIEVTTENPGSGNVGRRSWRELYLQ
jgi:hypothetical protein